VPEISCRATAGVIEVLERWGRDPTTLAGGLATDLETLRNPKRRVDWDDFIQFLRNLGESCTVEEIEQIGAQLFEAPAWSVPRTLTRTLVTPYRLARLGSVFASAVFPVLQFELKRIDAGSFTLTLVIPAERHGAREFFIITRGQWRELLTRTGHPELIVESEIDDHRGYFRFLYEPPRSIVGSLRDAAAAAMASPTWIHEVLEERHQLGEALAAMDRWRRDFHRVLDELQDAVIIHRQGRILYANPALRMALGRRDDELVGASLAELFAPESLDRARRSLDYPSVPDHVRALATQTPDGNHLLFELRQRQDIDFKGGPAELLVARDVTDARRVYELLLHADRMASLGMLAAGLAHEVNNPLGYVLNSLQIMRREIALDGDGAPSGPRRQQLASLLDVALEGTNRVRTIVGGLNEFSRSESTTATEVDLSRALSSALELAKPQLDDGIEVIPELAPVPRIIASESRLSQVFLNLILNACHALEEKGASPRRLWLRTLVDEEGRLVAEIEDDGIGIPAEVRDKVFDPFFTTKPAGVGTGLGLAICRDVVTRQGGRIDLWSRPGRGTRVRVTFPPSP